MLDIRWIPFPISPPGEAKANSCKNLGDIASKQQAIAKKIFPPKTKRSTSLINITCTNTVITFWKNFFV